MLNDWGLEYLGSDGTQADLGAKRVLEAFGVDEQVKRACSFAFSSRVVPSSWRAFTFDLPLAFFYVLAPDGNLSQVRALASGISKENFVLLAMCDGQVVLVLRRSKKDDNAPLPIPLRKEEDFERAVSAIRRFNFVSDELTAHSSLYSVVDLLRAGAERYFTNRGLFSNYFLKERLSGCLSERGRSPPKEAGRLLSKFDGEFPVVPEKVVRVLEALGYSVEIVSGSGYPEYLLRSHGRQLDAACVVAPAESLDVKMGDKVAPSYQAVAGLRRFGWVILTNGRFWRLYSGKVSSASTNYFEVDLDGVVAETDPRLVYFVSLFSASSFVVRDGVTDVDLIYDEGIKHAQGVEDELRRKVFDGGLFLNLVKGVLDLSPSKMYSQEELDKAKALALKLLYRVLFVLYAESRGLLPIDNARYKEFSLEFLRPRLDAFAKEPAGHAVWDVLKALFGMISKGDVEANLPQYDGALFEEDPDLDSITIKNEFLVPALRDLMESEGKGIDYQNLGVRHLGSLYEALLEYSVRQAKQPLVMYKEEILDAKYAEDLKQKPIGFIEKGELYLSVKGLARKGTGSYYTPDEIVTFLVKKGLEPHFKRREEQFRADLARLPPASKPRDLELEKKCTEDLLGLRVVDPAMGSGHFLVAVVNEITRWIINLLKEYPDAPLMREIEEFRRSIVEEQRKRGIRLDEDLLTDDVILKRMVMKRCVYGVDINPLAVELAKVSLWLDSFTIGTPLTFLDHHIRCGDSLIGLWMENIAPKVFDTTLERWTGAVSAAGTSLVEAVVMPADLTVEQVAQSREAYEAVRGKTRSLCVLLDMFCASVIEPELGAKLPKNLSLIEETYRKKEKPKWWADVKKALELAKKYRFFHWELEFPDAFTKDRRGFDVIVMNPPWDAVKPEDDDFFSIYFPQYRRIKSKEEKRKARKNLLKNHDVASSYEEYRNTIEQKAFFYKTSGQYTKRGGGDLDFWKLFLERALNLTAPYGSLAIVVPSALVTNQGAMQLRNVLFEIKIRTMYEFENAKGIFPDIHRSYKFVLLIADKAEPTNSFPAVFYLHDIEALEGKSEQEKFLEMPINFIKTSAPDSLSIPEVRSRKELDILVKLYRSFPVVGDDSKGWRVDFIEEFHSRDNFRTDGDGWLIIGGECFHQFILDYEKPSFSINPQVGLQHTNKHKGLKGINKEIHDRVRLAFRHVASSTNVRTFICCILPPHTFCYQSAIVVIPVKKQNSLTKEEYYRMIAYLAGVFNSMVFDFLLRTRININLTYFMVNQTPIPPLEKNEITERIIQISARLSSPDERFKEFAETFGVQTGALNMAERIRLLAELNALVAKLYHLTMEDLEAILQSYAGFKEDKEIEKLKEIRWSDDLIRRLNGEVRKRILPIFDTLNSGQSGEETV
jgi:hypothetical protein